MAEELTLAPIRRIILRHGDLKISEGAAEELRRAMGGYVSRVARTAIARARLERRRTLLARDIVAAVEEIEGRRATA